jgi:hypothetical protein
MGWEKGEVPEHIQAAARTVKEMTPERAKQLLEELFSMSRKPVEEPRLRPPAKQGEPEALHGEAAARNELSHRGFEDLTRIAEKRGLDIAKELQMGAHEGAAKVVNKIVDSMSEQELSEIRSFQGSRSPLKKQTPPAPKSKSVAKPASKPAGKLHFETTPVEDVPKPRKSGAGGEESWF